jgi:glycosyltransferase involved in cell wall biosynthesis
LSTKPTILIFIDWFWPGYLAGGPVQSIVSLVNYLHTDFNFKIVTTSSDLNSKTKYQGIETNKWTRSPLNCDVFYADVETLNPEAIKKIIDGVSFDKVYINSFFSKNFSIVPLQILNKYYKDKPVVFAPRGMLGAGALAIKKLKKRLFIVYSKLIGLHSNVVWHATSAQEEGEIKKVIDPKTQIVRISNLPKKMGSVSSRKKEKNKLNACFISRISEKKNLSYALEVLREIKDAGVEYSIYGPLEDEVYWEKCKELIKTLPKNITVAYKGSLAPGEIETALSKEHVLFLPTLNENFGHSIVEALLCGCPAIISDQTPWNDLEVNTAGFAIDLNNRQKFAEAISHYAELDDAEFSAASERAINYISNKIDLKAIADQYKKLFNDGIKN